MITHILTSVTGGRLNLRAAADSSTAITASISNETLFILSNGTLSAMVHIRALLKSNILH